jgi:uncharacterized protein YkwD
MKILIPAAAALLMASCAGKPKLSEPVDIDPDAYAGSAECCPAGCIQCPDPDPDPGPAAEVLAEMNRIRAQSGAGPLVMDARLTCAADAHSRDIGSRRACTHTGADGSTPWQRAERCGTRAYGEIVACGHRTGAAAVQGWYNSSGHRQIMLDRRYGKVGIAMHNYYWTAIFSF